MNRAKGGDSTIEDSGQGGRGRAGAAIGLSLVMGLASPVFANTAVEDAAAPDDGIQVYTVDLRRAILATPKGRKIKSKIDRRRRAQERKIRALEEKLSRRKKTLTQAQFSTRFLEIQERIDAVQSKLDAQQDRMLAPLLERFRGLIEAATYGTTVVLDTSVASPLSPKAACDRTVQLIRAYLDGEDRPSMGRRDPACQTRGMLLLRLDQVLNGLPETRATREGLDALRDKRQADIERQRREMAELQARAQSDAALAPEVKARRLQLERSFQTYQAEIRQAESEARDKLMERVRHGLAHAPAGRKELIFVEYFGRRPDLARSCEVSEWAGRWVRHRSGWSTLASSCPLAR